MMVKTCKDCKAQSNRSRSAAPIKINAHYPIEEILSMFHITPMFFC